MPKAVTEITSGNQFSRSGGAGTGNDSHTRVFRVVLSSPSETFNPETNPDIAVKVGDKHPFNDVYCTGYSVRFDGESRLVMVVTLEYGAAAGSQGGGQDPNSEPPEVRPANWTTSTTLMEVPAYVANRLSRVAGGVVATFIENPATPLVNPAGDIYEAVSKLVPVVNISITQKEDTDPTRHCRWAGYLNIETMPPLGSLTMLPGTCMFRGVSSTPIVENWGGVTKRLWLCTYEFQYRTNIQRVWITEENAEQDIEIGWGIVIPSSGYNVKCFDPAAPGATQDPYGQPLRMVNGKVVTDPALALPGALAVGKKARAMVRVPDVDSGGDSLAPSASPIPLNLDGTPRIETATPKVIVVGAQVQPAINLTATLNLRLQ